ncbi:hypothetical protein BDZ45DRAFT_777057 [Acephala macrosclerotiorum]|nr:hypothetical protein BDZ45DRAFT_777057 [Acephala macrosclerotiorum]
MSRHIHSHHTDLEDYDTFFDQFQFPDEEPSLEDQDRHAAHDELEVHASSRARKLTARRDAIKYNHGRSPKVAAHVQALQRDSERVSNFQTRRLVQDAREEAERVNEADIADSVETADSQPLEWARCFGLLRLEAFSYPFPSRFSYQDKPGTVDQSYIRGTKKLKEEANDMLAKPLDLFHTV